MRNNTKEDKEVSKTKKTSEEDNQQGCVNSEARLGKEKGCETGKNYADILEKLREKPDPNATHTKGMGPRSTKKKDLLRI